MDRTSNVEPSGCLSLGTAQVYNSLYILEEDSIFLKYTICSSTMWIQIIFNENSDLINPSSCQDTIIFNKKFEEQEEAVYRRRTEHTMTSYNDQMKSGKRTNNDLQEKFEDIKEVLTCRRSNLHTIQWAKENSNRRKKISLKHCTEN